MSHSYARWALLLLGSTIFVQSLAIEIPYNDPRVIYTPADASWSPWTYSATEPCPGIWSALATDGKHTISLNFTGTGITVYGYSDGVAPWLFQIDDGTPEASSVLPDLPCRVLKDLQGLPNGNHRVVVTPQSISFVLTKFNVVTGLSTPSGNRTGTNTTQDSRAFSLGGGNQVVAQVISFVLLVYFSMALSSL